VLSGADGDGSSGLDAIRLRGGITVAQEPAEAPFPGMPTTAIARVGVDYVRPVAAIPALLVELASHDLAARRAEPVTPQDDEPRANAAPADGLPLAEEKRDGQASGLTCPDCFGSIWELPEGRLVSFECRVGHRYNPEAFIGAQAARVEDALWTACNVLQERAAALRQFASRFSAGERLATEYRRRADETDAQAALVRSVIVSMVASEGVESSERR
jgi:two-component system chemotaxis response regulator CheB